MTLNLSKCNVVSFSRKKLTVEFDYSMNNSNVSRSSSYKYLGVHFTSNLTWAAHVTYISANASRTLGYLRRNLRNAPNNVRKQAYLTFVRPQLEFASPIWSPFQAYLINQLEAVQNRAARFISRIYSRPSSVTQIKHDLSLQHLDIRRTVALLSLLHKYIHASRPPPFPLTAPLRMSKRLHNQRSITRIFGKTKSFNSSALPRAIALWNDLPDVIVNLTNHENFREQLMIHLSQ